MVCEEDSRYCVTARSRIRRFVLGEVAATMGDGVPAACLHERNYNIDSSMLLFTIGLCSLCIAVRLAPFGQASCCWRIHEPAARLRWDLNYGPSSWNTSMSRPAGFCN